MQLPDACLQHLEWTLYIALVINKPGKTDSDSTVFCQAYGVLGNSAATFLGWGKNHTVYHKYVQPLHVNSFFYWSKLLPASWGETVGSIFTSTRGLQSGFCGYFDLFHLSQSADVFKTYYLLQKVCTVTVFPTWIKAHAVTRGKVLRSFWSLGQQSSLRDSRSYLHHACRIHVWFQGGCINCNLSSK